jgi:hypothetical protein
MNPFTAHGALGQPDPLKYHPTITPSGLIPEGIVWNAPVTSNRVKEYGRADARASDGEIVTLPASLAGARGFSAQAASVSSAAKVVAATRGVFMGVLP